MNTTVRIVAAIALAVPIGLLAASSFGGTAAAPALLAQSAIDAGEIPRGDSHTIVVPLANAAGRTVRVTDLRKSCSCYDVDLRVGGASVVESGNLARPAELSAGDEGELEFSFRAQGGRQTFALTIDRGDVDGPEKVTVDYRGIERSRVWFAGRPVKRVAAPETEIGCAQVVQLEIESGLGAPFHVERDGIEHGELISHVDVRPLDNGRWVIEAAVIPSREGHQSTRLRMPIVHAARGANRPAVREKRSVDVSVYAPSVVTADPEVVLLGRIDPRSGKTRDVDLRSRSGEPVTLRSVRMILADQDRTAWVSASDSKDASDRHRLQLGIPPGLANGPVFGELVLDLESTAHGAFEKVVPVRGFVGDAD